ncbi:hypothetical protein EVA_04999 [gut metagenome]|uniref:Uncharacterized protein n=1 Tax=gut metagenome TaxID=749906 RepID=J9H0P7_9ZZZZ
MCKKEETPLFATRTKSEDPSQGERSSEKGLKELIYL